ncbi:MAG TPA: hypothetical protein PK364_01955 [Synergistaceae bacterium]|nr:hypothetical protein [Synergistaceae bacterium]HPJ26358.1 hypothetical protein [Synergistaceae bacterium]HPQ36643.1 hypothetical protein [Synergistaceae bacterium]
MKRMMGLMILAAFVGTLFLSAPLMAMEKVGSPEGQGLELLSKGNGNGGNNGNGAGDGSGPKGNGNGAKDGSGPKGNNGGSGNGVKDGTGPREECNEEDCTNPDCPRKTENS